jgi:hypothetical protein
VELFGSAEDRRGQTEIARAYVRLDVRDGPLHLAWSGGAVVPMRVSVWNFAEYRASPTP